MFTYGFAGKPTRRGLRAGHLLTLFDALFGAQAYLDAAFLPVERGYACVRVFGDQVVRHFAHLAPGHAPVRLTCLPDPATPVHQAHGTGGARVPLARGRHLRHSCLRQVRGHRQARVFGERSEWHARPGDG